MAAAFFAAEPSISEQLGEVARPKESGYKKRKSNLADGECHSKKYDERQGSVIGLKIARPHRKRSTIYQLSN